jgi:hypothetical protein
LGVAHRVGQALCYWILTKTGKVLARTSIQKMNTDESNSHKQEIDEFDVAIHSRYHGNTHILDDTNINTNTYLQDIYEADMPCLPFDADATMPEDDDTPEQEVYDQYISAQVMLPRGDTFDKATVLRRKRDSDGNPIGRTHTNPILDTRVFEVQFSDGHCSEYATNVIAENLYATVDDDGFETLLFHEIVDHRVDRAESLDSNDAWITSFNGNKSRRRTTKGWQLCVEWRDGSTSWIPLKDLKASNPLQVAEYAVAHNIANEPAFVWWIYDTLKRRDRVIAAKGQRYVKRTHKFGIELPTSVDDALKIDRDSGTTFWHDAMQKEMHNNSIAFEFITPGENIPIGYKKNPPAYDLRCQDGLHPKGTTGSRRTCN